MKKIIYTLVIAAVLVNCSNPLPNNKESINFRKIYLDSEGVIRWEDNKQEVALFGANYCLPSASDYRAAGYISTDRKKMVDQDMAHFARMAWDGLRICLWGDWENSDKQGNLVENDHLDLMDYIIYKASEKGIYILFTPITTYNALWPDAMGDTAKVDGFSKHFKKSELGLNPDAIAAQVNYIKQILEHVNPYTGNAIKDEPSILLIEMINEPQHHSSNFEASVKYINALADAVKSTGCNKVLFHNVSQDMKIAPAIKASKVEGISFAWYPAGLVSGKTQNANLLRTVDEFPTMLASELDNTPRLVYEFDEADSRTPYMYPAMTRTFRSVGSQFTAMFSYDMLATAPYNLGWQTHAMNMVYYPQKAIGGILSSHIMKTIPLFASYGQYPENTSFGPFKISYEENQAEMLTNDKFIYANNTNTIPNNPGQLTQIIGYGTSTIVSYEGQGIYFLDKVENGVWRLELYPDAKIVSDPFDQPSPDKIVSRLVSKKWNMKISLPSLGPDFNVRPVNEGNKHKTTAQNGEFAILPGVYVLSSKLKTNIGNLPEYIGTIKFDEFVCPKQTDLPPDIIHTPIPEYIVGDSTAISAELVASGPILEASLYLASAKFSNRFRKIPMQHAGGYQYTATIPKSMAREGAYKYCISVKTKNGIRTFPSGIDKSPTSWGYYDKSAWEFKIVDKNAPLTLLVPEMDMADLAFTRIGDGIRHGIYDVITSPQDGSLAYRLYFPKSYDENLDDYTVSIIIKERIQARGKTILGAKGLKINARAQTKAQEAFVTLMEVDGTSWSAKISLDNLWDEIFIPIGQFKISKGVKLPQGYPERWNYWVGPAKGRGSKGDKLQLDKVERLQVSLRPPNLPNLKTNPWIEFGRVWVCFE